MVDEKLGYSFGLLADDGPFMVVVVSGCYIFFFLGVAFFFLSQKRVTFVT